MGTPTYTALATTTLTGSSLEVLFNSIDQSYSDLVLVVQGYTSNNTYLNVIFNDDTSASYNHVYMAGSGSGSASSFANLSRVPMNYYKSTDLGAIPFISIMHIANYSDAGSRKPIISQYGQVTSHVETAASMWTTLDAITSIKLYPSAGSIDADTVLTLYGIEE